MHLVVNLPIDEKAAFIAASLGDAKKTWSEPFNRGVSMAGKVPPLAATTSEDYGSKFLDVVPNLSLELIASQRLRDVFDRLGLKNVEYFPIAVTNWDSGAKHDYWVCNVVGTIPCLDRNRAKVRFSSSNPNKVFMMQRLAVEESAIKAFNDAREPDKRLRLFRLEEYPRYLLAAPDVAAAITAAGIEGVQLRKPDDCGDYL
jgi:hypothetical protein